jgi:hypothetical protein
MIYIFLAHPPWRRGCGEVQIKEKGGMMMSSLKNDS